MAYWNHFSQRKYKEIKFSSLAIGEEFREDFFKGKENGKKRRRRDVICVKTGELSYKEKKSGKEHVHISNDFTVCSLTEKI